MELSEVEVARVIEPEKVTFNYTSAVLMKEAIVFAITKGESPDGAESRVFKYVEKKPYDVLLTLQP